jgi:hypothetical protein
MDPNNSSMQDMLSNVSRDQGHIDSSSDVVRKDTDGAGDRHARRPKRRGSMGELLVR